MRPVSVAAAAAVLVLAACASTGMPQPSERDDPTVPGPNQVVIYKFIFKPKVLRVPVGTTVTWVNRDIAAHTATRNGGSSQFESGNMTLNRAFSRTFDTAGTYDYICFYHPGMKATIIVTPEHSTSEPGASTAAGQSASAPRSQ